MDISKLVILILRLYRFRSPDDIDRLADAVIALAEDIPGPAIQSNGLLSPRPSVITDRLAGPVSDPGAEKMPAELSNLLDLLRPMTEQQLKGISDLIKGGSRLDQIARLVDLELSQTGRDLPEYDKLISIQTQLTELRANKDKHGRSQIEKFNDRYGKK